MNWINFSIYAEICGILWLASIVILLFKSKKPVYTAIATGMVYVGILVLGSFIVNLWLTLDRPPMRTLGETRLWYSFFLSIIGIVVYHRWKYKWLLAYSLGMALLFLMLNYFNPEIHSKSLMPALQSPWFVPHVIVYIFAYALLAASSLVAVYSLFHEYFLNQKKDVLPIADNLVYIGFAFLTLGLLFGALWAKEAWGHYWTWDPKETWAFLTWLMYLVYIHFRHSKPHLTKGPLWTLSLAFVVLLIAWFGINYLPSAQFSVHTYGMGN
ncbi:MAG: cytochrome c biogenesis protein CcsA [Bacteroidales bacterium]|nr:cytochrome c biogenesis protein CcsA [Bacteroidales bacterium]